MPKCLILSGIPTSGKSTFAQEQVDSFIVSRDDVRLYLFGSKYKQNNKDEETVNRVFDARLKYFTSRKYDVIIDNCNVRKKYIDEIVGKIPAGYDIEIMFFDIPLWKAYIRNITRWISCGKWIPVKVIKNMYKSYVKLRKEYGKENLVHK